MGEKEMVFEIDELTQLTFHCQHCGTRLTFRADVEPTSSSDIPCPGCGRNYTQIRGALGAFREFLKAAKIDGLNTRITVRASALSGDQIRHP
jgi:hypothetical protein